VNLPQPVTVANLKRRRHIRRHLRTLRAEWAENGEGVRLYRTVGFGRKMQFKPGDEYQ
jgi:hypothetical protein